MKIEVYDNGGKTFDRYTVNIENYIYTMSKNADQHDGMNQYCFLKKGKQKLGGKRILYLDMLPHSVRKAILDRIAAHLIA